MKRVSTLGGKIYEQAWNSLTIVIEQKAVVAGVLVTAGTSFDGLVAREQESRYETNGSNADVERNCSW